VCGTRTHTHAHLRSRERRDRRPPGRVHLLEVCAAPDDEHDEVHLDGRVGAHREVQRRRAVDVGRVDVAACGRGACVRACVRVVLAHVAGHPLNNELKIQVVFSTSETIAGTCFSTGMSRNPGCPSGGICNESMMMMMMVGGAAHAHNMLEGAQQRCHLTPYALDNNLGYVLEASQNSCPFCSGLRVAGNRLLACRLFGSRWCYYD
jgi:hypothetical protein